MALRLRYRGCLLLLAWLCAGCGSVPQPSLLLDTSTHFEQGALAEQAAPQSYRIGINTEISGYGAQIGDLSIRAARLAIEQINAAGGINGVPLELVVRDCRSDVASALTQYQRAVAEDQLVALIGPLKSAYAVKIVPEHRQSRLPLFIGATNPALSELGDTRLFRMRPSDAVTAAAMVALAIERLQARRIGVIHDTDAFGSAGAEQVLLNLRRYRLSPLVQVGYTTGTRNFDALVHELAAARIDTLLIYGTNSTDVGILLRSIRYWGLDATLITSPGGASDVTRNVAAEAQDGIYVVTDAILSSTVAGAGFEQAFVERFGMHPDTYIAWIYDTVYLIAEGLRQAGAHPDALSTAIRNLRFQGVQGQYRFDEQGNGLHRVTLVRLQAGHAEPVGVFEAGQLTERLAVHVSPVRSQR